jgi:outer membrane autotransporter protein
MPLPADRALGSIEPQAQLAWQHNDFDDVLLGGARVQQDSGSGWIARLGLPIKGDLATSAGPFQPYGRLNFYTRTSAAMPLFSSGRPHRPSSRARAATARAKSTRARPWR